MSRGDRAEVGKIARWSWSDIRDQRGRVVLITGANSGIEFETAKVFAAHAATVVLACRDVERAEQAAAALSIAPGGSVRILQVDLSSIDSIRRSAAEFRTKSMRLDLLINNAAVMWTPPGTTHDGFELQFGVNHLGHFALTGLLLDRLLRTPSSRVVVVSSGSHRKAALDFADLQSTHRYRPMTAYGKSKLANLLFAFELQRRLAAIGSETIALAAHPGAARTALVRHSPRIVRTISARQLRFITAPLLQDARMGALPILRAAVDVTAHGGDYFGPANFLQATGYPIRVEPSSRSRDERAQQRLWSESERLTGVTYEFS